MNVQCCTENLLGVVGVFLGNVKINTQTNGLAEVVSFYTYPKIMRMVVSGLNSICSRYCGFCDFSASFIP